jgi:MFS family permease
VTTGALTETGYGRALRAERLFIAATFITMLGNNIQLIASSLLVYRTAGTALSIGWVFILVAVPQVLLSALFGRVADRFDRRTLCIVTDLASVVVAVALPLAVLAGVRPSIAAYLVSFGLALLAAMFMPASNALLKERVAPSRLGHASANYELAYQGGALLSGVAGGLVAQFVGLMPLFYFNSATFLASAACLALLGRRTAATAPTTPHEAPQAVVPGPAGPARGPVVRLGLLFAIGTVIVTVANTLLLVVVVRRFHQGAGLLGVADALAGIGMLTAATIYKRYQNRVDHRVLILVGYVACASLALVQPIAVWTLLPAIFLGGVTFGLGRVPSRAELLRSVDEHRVGRVFGVTNAFALAASVAGTVVVAAVLDHAGVIPGFVTLAALTGVPALLLGLSLFRVGRPATVPAVPEKSTVLDTAT